MTAYRGKAPTTKCARCSGRGYRFKVVGGELETVDCNGCDGRGRVDEPMITFTAKVPAKDKDGDFITKDAMRDAVERGSMDLQTSAGVAQNVIDGFSEPGCPDCEGHGRPGWIELATSWVRCDCNQESDAS